MSSNLTKKMITPIVLLMASIWVIYWMKDNYQWSGHQETTFEQNHSKKISVQNEFEDIASLTEADRVVRYIRAHHRLPDYYITKSEARKSGWNPGQGNLCDVIPGHAIGGDVFGNREGKLPQKKGRKYFEADIEYDCGNRDANRLVFSNDGLIYISRDHYKTFQKQ